MELEIIRGGFRFNNCDPRLRSVYSTAGAARLNVNSVLITQWPNS